MPFYWFTMKVCGRDTYFGLTYEEIMMQNMDSTGVMAGAAQIRLSSWYFISIAASFLSLFFSTAIILDLYFVLKNPFSS